MLSTHQLRMPIRGTKIPAFPRRTGRLLYYAPNPVDDEDDAAVRDDRRYAIEPGEPWLRGSRSGLALQRAAPWRAETRFPWRAGKRFQEKLGRPK